MDASLTTPDTHTSDKGTLVSYWTWMTKVSSSAIETERYGRFVAAVSGVVSLILIVAAVWALLASRLNFNSVFLIAALITFVSIYIANRIGNYDAAVVTLIGAFALAPVIFVVGEGKDIALLELAAVISSVSVVLVGTFYTKQAWSLVAGLLVAAIYLLLPIAHPVYSLAEVVYPVASLLIVSALSLAVQQHLTGLEHDKLAKLEAIITAFRASEAELIKVNALLEREGRDRDIELQAVADEYERAVAETDQAREQSERANHVKSAFLASMSHELRTPLNAIINFTKFVVNGDLGPVNAEQTETLIEVVNSGKHLLSLINDVLDMSKIESGSLNLFIEDGVDVKGIITTVVSTCKILLAEKPVELTVAIDENLPSIRADRQRVVQVLLNIMSNACKFTNQGSIAVRVNQQGEDLVIAVQDSGPGIAPEDQALVFEAFKQTDAGLRQGGGTGLGMPISKNLAEAHGGRLWLESEQGKGSTFFVSLPVKSEQLVAMFTPGGIVK